MPDMTATSAARRLEKAVRMPASNKLPDMPSVVLFAVVIPVFLTILALAFLTTREKKSGKSD